MKRATIEKNIKNKLEEWLDTITDKRLARDLKNKLLVSGGCISSMLLNEQVNDYDIYLSDINIVKRICKYYTKDTEIEILDGRRKSLIIKNSKYDIDEVNNQYTIAVRTLKENQIKLFIEDSEQPEICIKEIEEKSYTPRYFSPNCITLSDNIQIVIRFHGDHVDIHKNFDFVHATNYFTFKDGLVTNIEALESILSKTLIYKGSLYPLTSIIRSKKFVKRGFNIGAGEYLKIMFQISQLDLTNFDTLEEQLIGVDVAYFSKLITILREMSLIKDFNINSGLLNELINRVFNQSE